MQDMYAYKEIKNKGKDLDWWQNRILSRIIGPMLFRKNDGFYVMKEEWKNLIILDACRYDIFKEVNTINGELNCKISRGSVTTDFLTENFGKGKFKDIIYITGNPYVTKLLQGKFYKIVSVWREGWDEDFGTVLPSTMVDYTIEVYKKYPEKKLIIHFMQPHSPWIKKEESQSKHGPMETIGKNIGRKESLRRYKDNLRLVLPYVNELINILDGKTIITADHGEMIGEKIHPFFPLKWYGHPGKVRNKILTEVPWLIIDRGEDKQKIERIRIRNKIQNLKKGVKI